MGTKPIGIFDSGIGGLAIAKKIWQLIPNQDTVYLGDHLYCPYGEKNVKQICKRLIKAVRFFQFHQVKLIVIACNTATVNCLQLLRKKFTIPFIGTVPAIKPAVALKPKNHILVLATDGTIASEYQEELKDRFDSQKKVISFSCPGLVSKIENNGDQPEEIKQLLEKCLRKIKVKFNVVVLGCTHYILVRECLESLLPKTVKIIDPSTAIAKQARAVLVRRRLLSQKKFPAKRYFFTTGDAQKVTRIASSLMKKSIIFTSCSL